MTGFTGGTLEDPFKLSPQQLEDLNLADWSVLGQNRHSRAIMLARMEADPDRPGHQRQAFAGPYFMMTAAGDLIRWDASEYRLDWGHFTAHAMARIALEHETAAPAEPDCQTCQGDDERCTCWFAANYDRTSDGAQFMREFAAEHDLPLRIT
jgi:hypothetical protein